MSVAALIYIGEANCWLMHLLYKARWDVAERMHRSLKAWGMILVEMAICMNNARAHANKVWQVAARD